MKKNSNKQVVQVRKRVVVQDSKKNKNIKNNSQNQKKRKQKTNALVKPRFALSPCAERYFHALLNPFDNVSDELPCIPDILDVPSFKFATKQRGTVTIGTLGFGFIAVSPYAYGSDVVNLIHSSATYASSAFPGITARSAAITEVSNTRFVGTSSTGPACRVVGAGLRVRYSGTELNRGGTILPVCANNISDDLSAETVAEVLGRPTVRPVQNNRQWVGVCLKAMQMSDYTYTADTSGARSLINGANIHSGEMKMGIGITGVVGNTFDYEYAIFYEAIPCESSSGNVNSIPSTTKSHSDLTGLSMIRDFVGGLFDSDIGKTAIEAGKKYFESYAANMLTSTTSRLLLL